MEYYIVSIAPDYYIEARKFLNVAMGNKTMAYNYYNDYINGKIIRKYDMLYYTFVYLTKFIIDEDGKILNEFYVEQTSLIEKEWYRDLIARNR